MKVLNFFRVVAFNLWNITHYPKLVFENVSVDVGHNETGDGFIFINGREYSRMANIHGEASSNFGFDLEHASKRLVAKRDGTTSIFQV